MKKLGQCIRAAIILVGLTVIVLCTMVFHNRTTAGPQKPLPTWEELQTEFLHRNPDYKFQSKEEHLGGSWVRYSGEGRIPDVIYYDDSLEIVSLAPDRDDILVTAKVTDIHRPALGPASGGVSRSISEYESFRVPSKYLGSIKWYPMSKVDLSLLH